MIRAKNVDHLSALKKKFSEAGLVLFDLDGLLVDTEHCHWQAYVGMCRHYGYALTWDFTHYLQIAGTSATSIRDAIMKDHPQLEQYSWEELYQRKKEELWRLLEEEPIPLMQGVAEMIACVREAQKPMAVVTHSPSFFVQQVQRTHVELAHIPLWVSREMYINPKPAPDGYKVACSACNINPDCAIGFEDSWRGICALRDAGCTAVLVNNRDEQIRSRCDEAGIATLSSFLEIIL